MKQKLKIGIIGCGAIGTEIAKVCLGILKDSIDLVSIFDIDKNKIKGLEKKIGKNIGANSLDTLIEKSDFLFEAASSSISAKMLELAIAKFKDIMIMSIGGLLNREDLLKKAQDRGIKVYLPSGALAGIDALKAAGISKIESVTLITKKPPRGLEGAPYLLENNIDLNKISDETVVFEGNAEEAIKGFPKNINVSALLSLAGIGADKTRVKIITSPSFTKNAHEVEIKGVFGIIKTETINVPSSANPKTSSLAALSAIATLKGIVGSVKIGT
ncbi:MAG: aspartate dehydrogenase [Candidatus Omnitrophica bacterium]|nr:aspartate dehydrogenase [Candidatus Omnitrophota bacterium]